MWSNKNLERKYTGKNNPGIVDKSCQQAVSFFWRTCAVLSLPGTIRNMVLKWYWGHQAAPKNYRHSCHLLKAFISIGWFENLADKIGAGVQYQNLKLLDKQRQ